MEVSFTEERIGWILSPRNSENRTEVDPATGGKEAEGRAEARGIDMVSSTRAMARETESHRISERVYWINVKGMEKVW